jgi:hypothetical protein
MPRSTVLLATLLVLAGASLLAGCEGGARSARDRGEPRLDESERASIADSLQRLLVSAYDLTQPGADARMLALYPDSGRVISATGGQLSSSRDSVVAAIRTFWENVGSRMREPRWTWGPMYVDVLSRDAAVLTATYVVPHRTPDGRPHTIAGAMTSVFARRGGRWVIVQEHLSDIPPQLLQQRTEPAEHTDH